jgi:hypothetical protein
MTTIRPETIPFWKPAKNGCSFNHYLLDKFLMQYGFRQFQTVKDRTVSNPVILNDDGILKVYNGITIKKWVRDWLESVDEKEFQLNGSLDTTNPGVDSVDKLTVLDKWQSFAYGKLQTIVLDTLQPLSQQGFPDTEQIDLFEDTSDKAHVRFKNGVVKITKDDIQLLNPDEVRLQGAVWESSIIDREIKITDGTSGLFKTFTELSMYRKDPSITDEDWTKEYSMTPSSDSQYLSLRTAYGYLVHTFNSPTEAKGIIFGDVDSDIGKPQGGNGKSVIMESIGHFKKLVYQDGKKIKPPQADGGRFQFSTVTVDAKFLWIDDLRENFRFEDLFSTITNDMEVEGKGINKFVIPKDKKPKLGMTTNYVIPGVGTSHSRRKHVVQFGNYWNRCVEEGESPSDDKHLGKSLFEENFTNEDWNDFYNYGFRCVQEYFEKGLVQSDNSQYEIKSIKVTVEGVDGSGVFTDWLDDWIKVDRLKDDLNVGDGISLDDLWSKFSRDNLLEILGAGGSWDKKRFDQGVWDFTDNMKGYQYNGHLSKNGASKSSRRMQKGPAGNQKPYIRITTGFDGEWMDQMNNLTSEIEPANENDQSSPEGMYWSNSANMWMKENTENDDDRIGGYFEKLAR